MRYVFLLLTCLTFALQPCNAELIRGKDTDLVVKGNAIHISHKAVVYVDRSQELDGYISIYDLNDTWFHQVKVGNEYLQPGNAITINLDNGQLSKSVFCLHQILISTPEISQVLRQDTNLFHQLTKTAAILADMYDMPLIVNAPPEESEYPDIDITQESTIAGLLDSNDFHLVSGSVLGALLKGHVLNIANGNRILPPMNIAITPSQPPPPDNSQEIAYLLAQIAADKKIDITDSRLITADKTVDVIDQTNISTLTKTDILFAKTDANLLKTDSNLTKTDNQLTSQNNSLTKQNTTLTNDITTQQNNISKDNTDIAKQQAIITKDQAKLLTAKPSQIANLNKVITNAQTVIATDQAKINTANGLINGYQATVSANQHTITVNSATISHNAGVIAVNANVIATNKQSIAANKATIAHNQTQISTNKSQISSLNHIISINKAQIKVDTAQVHVLQGHH